MDRVTTALELLGMALVILAIGWQVAALTSVPLGLCGAATASWLMSAVLQGAALQSQRRRSGS